MSVAPIQTLIKEQTQMLYFPHSFIGRRLEDLYKEGVFSHELFDT